jgi:hypothetical protein
MGTFHLRWQPSDIGSINSSKVLNEERPGRSIEVTTDEMIHKINIREIVEIMASHPNLCRISCMNIWI